MSIERLSAEDALMLWPDAVWPQDIGALIILDGSHLHDSDGRFRIDTVRQAVAARLDRVARFRQLLHVPAPDLGGPLWIDATAFDLTDHVTVTQLPAPADETQLLFAVEQARRQRLDRSRPLWEMRFFTGMPDGRVALFLRMHHALADGMAGVATMATFLDTGPDASTKAAEPWFPAAMPTEAQLRDDVRQQVRRRRRQALSGLVHPIRTLRPVLAAWPAVGELLAQRPLPATSLDRRVGPARTFALVRSRLDEVKDVAHAHGATVNDVLLTAVTGGLRELLRSRAEPADAEVRVYVPISLHRLQGQEIRGNLISQMVVTLPLGGRDPASNLRHIARASARSKAKSHPSLGWMPHRGIAGRAFLRLVGRQRVNVTTADIPGPPMPLYFAGARLMEVFPLTQLIANVSIGIAAISYAGQFNLMVVADGDAYPDLDVLAKGCENELNALGIGTGVITPPVHESPRPVLAAAVGG